MKKLNLNLSALKTFVEKAESKIPVLKPLRAKLIDRLPLIKKVLKYAIELLLCLLPFFLMDYFIKDLAADVRFTHEAIAKTSRLFSVLWIFLFVAVSKCLKGELGRIVYGLIFAVFLFAFFTQSVYYPYTDFFFGFNLLQSAEEGKGYIWEVVKNTEFKIYLKFLFVLAVGVFAFMKFPKSNKNRLKILMLSFVVFIVVYANIPSMMGTANKTLEWDTWKNPRNVYESFSDRNKNMKICGMYEYSLRDLYITYLRKNETNDPDEVELVADVYSEEIIHNNNSYTGMFEGKNVIFVQLEGLDSWLLNEETTPNLYGMMENSIVYNNHFSYYTGGGSTFNSELAVTTGFITPISYTKNPYAFTENYFPHSLPRLLKDKGYKSNAFHMNTGEYYTRDLNYKNWGFDNYYSLMEDGNYLDKSYQLDRELILNEFFYEKMFKQEQPFMNYVITYTTHTPFNLICSTGQLIAAELYPDLEEPPELGEEEVARLFAKETDNMMGLLLQALEDNGLIDNTIIVAYADHYLYTLNDKTILEQYKDTENNLINKTPFFIWSNGMNKKQVDKVNSQLDILPTVLNLLGVEYNDEWFVGKDIMDDSYSGYVFFSDYSWYDGINYVENGEVVNNLLADQQYITNTNTEINNLIQKNDLTLKYDFFKKKK